MKCEDCYWYIEVHGGILDIKSYEIPDTVTYVCSYSENVTVNYLGPDKVKRAYEDINKDGKCGWFEKLI